jgi:pimeloyl-ACP methyl ester carboxylesterase
MVADAGHFLQLESPDEVAQAIAGFVQGLPELRGDA